ncbi:DUF3908 family protein [Neobacillus drentensis]|uniref:DUF3908 family protein n=1 Tax=Neobacillus drentensis TaxID=220684 RepID=UPI002FFD6395
MDDNLSFKKFLDWVDNYSLNSETYKFENIMRQTKEFIPESDIKIFYPQYLFRENVETNLLLFTKTKVYKITGDESRTFFHVFNLKDVVDVNFQVFNEAGRDNFILNISFTSDKHLSLNSLNDTNDHWRNTFINKIKAIFQTLLNN